MNYTPLKRQPREEGDLERGFFTQIWRPGGKAIETYCCLFCLFDSQDLPGIERHLANHRQVEMAMLKHQQEQATRPLDALILDAGGKPIERIERTEEELDALGSLEPEE